MLACHASSNRTPPVSSAPETPIGMLLAMIVREHRADAAEELQELRFGQNYALRNYPLAACCRHKGRSLERPLLIDGSTIENKDLCRWIKPAQQGGRVGAA